MSSLTVAALLAGIAAWNSFSTDSVKEAEKAAVAAQTTGWPVELPGKLPDTLLVDPGAQAFSMELVERFPTVLTIAFGMDLRTGRPLFLAVSESGKARVDLPLAVAPRFPTASLAKMVTAWATLSETKMRPGSVLWLRGKAHTLYKPQLDTAPVGGKLTLADAFAYSVNPVFGRLGLHYLGAPTLLRWADSLGFNRPQGLGNGVPAGVMAAPRDDYNLAEVASGFVRTTYLSPVHAAMLARRFATNDRLLPPSWTGRPGDTACPSAKGERSQAHKDMLNLMYATVDSGTARRSFGAVWRDGLMDGFQVGGKTGSLDGTNPKGRYEWFAGFARVAGDPDSGIAVGVMTVGDNRRSLPAAWVAAQLTAYWRRHAREAPVAPMAAAQARAAGEARFLDGDREALGARPLARISRAKKIRSRAGKSKKGTKAIKGKKGSKKVVKKKGRAGTRSRRR